jgi:hypothetical protein
MLTSKVVEVPLMSKPSNFFIIGISPQTIFLLLNRVSQRNEARKAKAAEKSKAADKIGYVPRNKQTNSAAASGLSSSAMSRGKDPSQQLDAESAAGLAKLKDADAEIDAGIDAISKTIDNLNNIAGQMKDEVSRSIIFFEEILFYHFVLDIICFLFL